LNISSKGDISFISSEGDIVFNQTPKVGDNSVLTSLPDTANFTTITIGGSDFVEEDYHTYTGYVENVSGTSINIGSGFSWVKSEAKLTTTVLYVGDFKLFSSNQQYSEGSYGDGVIKNLYFGMNLAYFEYKDTITNGYNQERVRLHVNGTRVGRTIQTDTVLTLSDDRLKINEKIIRDSSPLLKLRPMIYDKLYEIGGNVKESTLESGLIAQEIWYDCPELRHLVKLGDDIEPDDHIKSSEDPTADPDYSSWGPDPVAVNYTGLIPYLIRGFQEHFEKIDTLEKVNKALMKRLDKIEAMISGNVETM